MELKPLSDSALPEDLLPLTDSTLLPYMYVSHLKGN